MRDLNDYELSLYRNGYRLDETNGEWSKPPKADCVAPDAEPQPDTCHECVGKDAGKVVNPCRRLIRLTSFRVRLADARNLHDKHFTDALVRAGAVVDDSDKYCKIEVEQKQVEHAWQQRTEIEVFEL